MPRPMREVFAYYCEGCGTVRILSKDYGPRIDVHCTCCGPGEMIHSAFCYNPHNQKFETPILHRGTTDARL